MSNTERNRRQINFGKRIPEKWLIFSGDCALVNEFLETKSGKSIFVLLQYVNSLLRSFGQVISANNPISGLIIIVAISAANYQAMLAALLTSSLSFLFAKFLQQDVLGNLNGFFSYNAVLHAVFSVGNLPYLYDSISLSEPKFWMFLIFATLLSVYFTSALGNLLRYLSHYPMPCFTLPFNVLQYILLFCLLHNSLPPKILGSHLLEPSLKPNISGHELLMHQKNESFGFNNVDYERLQRKHNGNDNLERLISDDEIGDEAGNISLKKIESFANETHLDWGETFSGTIVALSQVYGLNNVPCSVLMFLALIIYSPTTALFCYTGSLLGTLVGISFASDVKDVYNGLWGYNGLLSAGALAGFGFVLTPQSAFLSLTAVLFSTVFQHFITPLFIKLEVPMLHVPFLVTVILFLLVTSDVDKALPRPGILTYPEKHRQEFREQCKEHFEGYLSRARINDNLSS